MDSLIGSHVQQFETCSTWTVHLVIVKIESVELFYQRYNNQMNVLEFIAQKET